MTGQIVWSCSVLLPPITTLNPHLLVPQSLCSLLSSHELCMTQDDQSHFAKLGNNFWLFHWRIIAKTVNLYLIRTSKSVCIDPCVIIASRKSMKLSAARKINSSYQSIPFIVLAKRTDLTKLSFFHYLTK